MPSNCSFPIPTPLKCKFPVCPCAKCQDRREVGGQSISTEEKDYDGAADKRKIRECGAKAKSKDGGSSNTNRSLMSFITDTISIIAFFIIATAMFWIAVAHYTFVFGMTIYKSGRNSKMATLVLICLLVLSISYSMVRKNGKTENGKEDAFPAYYTESRDKINTQAHKSTQNFTGTLQKGNSTSVTKNITVTITDSCAREIFKQSKLFAIPTEMKQPPALLVYLKDVILNNF